MWKFIPLIAAVLALAIFPAALSASAEPFPNTEKGADYTKERIGYTPDGGVIYNWSSSPLRMFDGVSYQDYIITQDANTITLETANSGSFVFNKNTCSYDFHDSGFIDELNPPKVSGISWTVKGKSSASSTWTAVNTINNAACVVSVDTTESTVRLVGEKSAASGIFQIVLEYSPGKGIKETFRAYNNNPAWNSHNIGFTEKMDVPQFIRLGNTVYDLSQHNNTVLGRNWIENNEAKLVRLSDKIIYDFGIGFENLNDIKIMWDGSQASLALNYLYPTQTVPYQEWFEVDPTFGYTAGTNRGVETAAGAGTACPVGYVNDASGGYVQSPDSGLAQICRIQGWYWDITTIPDDSVITDVRIQYDVAGVVIGTFDCAVNSYEGTMSTDSATVRWVDFRTGTNFTTTMNCDTTLTNEVLDLGASADADLQAELAVDNQWGIGVVIVGIEPRIASARQAQFTGMDLQVTYVLEPPNPPTALVAESQARKVQYNWTQANGTGVITYYLGRSLNNATWTNGTNTGNVTAYLDHAYYRPGLLYYANVTSSNGFNSTSAYTSFTMDDYPGAPNDLYKTNVNSTYTKLNWSPPTDDGNDAVTGYRVEAATGSTCTGFATLTNHTTALNWNHTGLATTQQYCYRVAAWNGVGLGDYSDTVFRLQFPDAVTDLTIISVFQTTAEISWTEPNLRGGTLYAYIVYYTSPWGTPSTVLESNATDTEYTILGLTPNTQYSFLVAVNTTLGVNASGNIVNISTPTDFTPGTIDFDTEIIPSLPIRFIREDVNSTFTELDVIYDNAYDMDCVMFFRFAQDNQTFTSLAGTAYNDNEDVFTFQFNNPENEIIDIRCSDTISNRTANFQMIQSNFPFLDLITDFRNGTYGTYGQFGAIDMITLLVVIIGMVGFNRINPSVGAIFFVAILGATAAFQIIQWYTALTAGIALVTMLIIGSTRKDD